MNFSHRSILPLLGLPPCVFCVYALVYSLIFLRPLLKWIGFRKKRIKDILMCKNILFLQKSQELFLFVKGLYQITRIFVV